MYTNLSDQNVVISPNQLIGDGILCDRGRGELPPNYSQFATVFGLYQFARMPFGLKNAGASYCRFVQRLVDILGGSWYGGILGRCAYTQH